MAIDVGNVAQEDEFIYGEYGEYIGKKDSQKEAVV